MAQSSCACALRASGQASHQWSYICFMVCNSTLKSLARNKAEIVSAAQRELRSVVPGCIMGLEAVFLHSKC